jgi:hypothetical protein
MLAIAAGIRWRRRLRATPRRLATASTGVVKIVLNLSTILA